MGEVTTAVEYGVGIARVPPNNSEPGKMSKEPRAGEWDAWETDLHESDLAAYVELCGAHGIRVTLARDVDDGLVEVLDHDGPSITSPVVIWRLALEVRTSRPPPELARCLPHEV